MEIPNINFNYWSNRWHENIGNSRALNVNYTDFTGTLNELVAEILRIVNLEILTDEDILNAIDLINQWGGSESRWFYIAKTRTLRNGNIEIRIPRELIELPENLAIYRDGINLASQNNSNSVNYFLQIFGIGPSYIGKHAYFWSNCNLPIVDAKIAGCFGYRDAKILLYNHNYDIVLNHMNFIKNNNNLIDVVTVEKALFAFHKNYFENSNKKFVSNIEDFTDCKYAIHIAKLLGIQIPENVLNKCLKS
ncbi:hypothetical protein [Flavobacterium aciduliphilum]|uniref:Uncharacterized protein n=1 Tax=Flavobacterium aciduliphilum TaxID=1101402 RepID=A0A328YLU7_9FLAO|nr:hypothetical protein [Flavobacterium aciduliphilum]RAR73805.1 hypothetical protein CLV55_103124 [Flavobacterium aciduliphilum]